MANRGYIPSSPACGQWETLLAEALDGQLRPEDAALFHEHMSACPACTALYEEANRGREWLEYLSPEPEVPEGLLDRILAQTGPGQVAGFGLVAEPAGVAAMPQPAVPAWQRAGFMGRVRRYAEPRLLMTAAMAFFSIALTLYLTGVNLNEVRLSDLRPSSIRAVVTRHIVTASIPLIRYYDHLRFMYEVESSMRQVRSGPSESESQTPKARPSAPGESKDNGGGKNGGSRVDPPQRSAGHDAGPTSGVWSDYVEAAFIVKDRPSTPAMQVNRHGFRPAHSGGSQPQRPRLSEPSAAGDPGSVRRVGERSILWTA